MKLLFTICIVLLSTAVRSQTVIFDEKHWRTVMENGAFRSAAESRHDKNLTAIKTYVNDVNINVGSVVLVQKMIFRSLTEVDGAIRHGKNVQYLGRLVDDIVQNGNKLVEIGKEDPVLLPFAEKISLEMKERAISLVTEVSSFVLKGGRQRMMNYNSRDELLKHVMTELRIIRGLSYAALQSMRYAMLRGVIQSINPFQGYVDKDISNIRYIIRKVDYLK